MRLQRTRPRGEGVRHAQTRNRCDDLAALVILLAVALPVAADSEYAGAVHSIDWRNSS